MTEAAPYSGVPVWQKDSEARECPICSASFNFLFRKHHCRMCGRVVCRNCSPRSEQYLATTYVVTPPNQPFLESPHIPHRTCLECSAELAMIRRALSRSPQAPDRRVSRVGSSSTNPPNLASELMVQNVVPGVDNDYLGRCPVCDLQLFNLPEPMQEAHVDACLKTYSASPAAAVTGPQRKRMLISRLPMKESVTIGECPICYEDFEPGHSVGRLECLCVFHEKCILEWFSRKGVGSCPLHNHDA